MGTCPKAKDWAHVPQLPPPMDLLLHSHLYALFLPTRTARYSPTHRQLSQAPHWIFYVGNTDGARVTSEVQFKVITLAQRSQSPSQASFPYTVAADHIINNFVRDFLHARVACGRTGPAVGLPERQNLTRKTSHPHAQCSTTCRTPSKLDFGRAMNYWCQSWRGPSHIVGGLHVLEPKLASKFPQLSLKALVGLPKLMRHLVCQPENSRYQHHWEVHHTERTRFISEKTSFYCNQKLQLVRCMVRISYAWHLLSSSVSTSICTFSWCTGRQFPSSLSTGLLATILLLQGRRQKKTSVRAFTSEVQDKCSYGWRSWR